MKRPLVILSIIVIILAIIYYYYYYKNEKAKSINKKITNDGNYKILTYRLPTEVNPDVFGPHYWKAIHNMANEIPCSSCREKWKSFTEFGHDMVNHSLGKPFYNRKNFDEWTDYISKTKQELESGKSKK